jgi:hypothetical protein
MKFAYGLLMIVELLVAAPSCAKAPPDLTPEASVAFKGTQVVKALDLLRDTSVTANAQVPPVLSEDVTRKVVLYHQSTVKIIQASPSGWVTAAQQGLDELTKNLSASDKATLVPYVTLVKTVLAEVTR